MITFCLCMMYFLLWFPYYLFCESGKTLKTVSKTQRKSLSESISGGITDVSLKVGNA